LRCGFILFPRHECGQYSNANKTYWVALSYSVSSFILLLPVWIS
jgi:hypothetical protein